MNGTAIGRRFFRQLVAVLVLLVIADGLLTRFITSRGLGQETNPVVSTLIRGGGLLPVKIAGALLAGIGLLDLCRRQPRVALWSSVAFVGIYTAIVYWNIGVVFFGSARAI